jgi:hypothetical protein
MRGSDQLISDSATCCYELIFGEGAVFCFPLGNRAQSISNDKGSASSTGHPSRDADALIGGCGQDLLMDVRIHRDREFG